MHSVRQVSKSSWLIGELRAPIWLALILMVSIVMLSQNGQFFVEGQEQLTVESRQQKDNDDLTDTIKFLQKVDNYFEQIARPRFGRSEYKQPGARYAYRIASDQQPRISSALLDLINAKLASRYRNSMAPLK